MTEETTSSSVLARPAQGLLRSRTLWLALIVTLAGAAWWAYAAITAPKVAPAPDASALVDAGSSAGLGQRRRGRHERGGNPSEDDAGYGEQRQDRLQPFLLLVGERLVDQLQDHGGRQA